MPIQLGLKLHISPNQKRSIVSTFNEAKRIASELKCYVAVVSEDKDGNEEMFLPFFNAATNIDFYIWEHFDISPKKPEIEDGK